MIHQSPAPEGSGGGDAWRSIRDVGGVGCRGSGCAAMGPHLRYQFLWPDVGLLGTLIRRHLNRLWDRQLHHCRLPVPAKFPGRHTIRRHGRLSSDREPNTPPSRPSDRRNRAWLPPLCGRVRSLRHRTMDSAIHLLRPGSNDAGWHRDSFRPISDYKAR